MTKSIDERIVEMQFDNKQFEKGIGTSLNSIDKLKKGLNFDKAVNSLSGLERAGRNFSLVGISDTLDRISEKFSALGIVGITVLQNLTNSAINAGKNIVKALTIDPVKTGLEEYETKMNAITTILTNTASKGTTIDDVNKALNELNKYSDKTIYNFAEMTKNVGTFTAAGIGLNEATTAIKGIANLGAGSGSTPLQVNMAMYQLSQALAAGSVKLIDWNSVVNAGMGGELFKNALTKTAKEMGIFVDETKPFRETLEQGWVTSDVLTKTLVKFANDPALIEAATQVKTFTQLISTMKESVQSGWAQSWENIIGNKDEAAKFFTAVNDGFNGIVGASADARNATLAFWNANGGRAAIIDALANAFKGLQTILKPIGEAYREIFPAMTGQRLIEISKAIRDLTVNFKIGESTAAHLKSTFKGLFAVLDIGQRIFTGIVSALASVIKFMFPVGDSVLYFTGTIGDLLVSLDKTLTSSNAFTNTMKKIGQAILPLAKGIRLAIVALINAIASLGSMDMGVFDGLAKRLQLTFEPLTSLSAIAKDIGSVFYGLASFIGQVCEKIRKLILNSLDVMDFNMVFDAINSGLIAAILLALKKFIDSLSKLSNKAGGVLGGITGTLDGVCGSLQALQNNLKSGVLLKIAISLGILAAALLTISKIDSKKLTSSLGAITALFLELFGSMAMFDMIVGTAGFIAMMKITTGMILLSTAVLILAGAMKKLSQLDWKGVIKGLTGITGMAAVLVGSSKMLAGSSAMLIQTALAFVVFAVAINILTRAVRKLGELNGTDLTEGLIGIGILLAELKFFMNATNIGKMGIINSIGILIFAEALVVLAGAVKKISTIDTKALIRGLTGVAVLLTEVVVFTNVVGNPIGLVTTAAGLTILGGAMLLLANALTKMGNMSWGETSRGLLVMAGALAAITVAFNMMPNTIFLKSIALIDAAGAITMLGNTLGKMAKLSWQEVARGLVSLTVSLGLMAGMFKILKQSDFVDATSFTIMAGGIMVLAVALKTLGSMSLAQVGISLLALTGAFTILGTAAIILSPLIPVMLGLGATMALFGVSVLALGTGVLMLGTGLAALAVAGTAASVTLVAVVTSIAGLIPFVFKQLGQGVVEFVTSIANSASAISDSVVKIVLAVLKGITTLIPSLVDLAGKLITTLLDALLKYAPKIIDTGLKLLIGLLKGFRDNIKEVVTVAMEFVINFINGISAKLPQLIQAGFDLMVSFLNGLADAIEKNAPIVVAAFIKLATALPKAALNVLGAAIGDFVGMGKNVVQGLIDGIKSMISAVANIVGDLSTEIVDTAKSVLGINSPSKVFDELIGQMIGAGMAAGITKSSKKATTASAKMAQDSADAAKEAFKASVEWINDRKYYNQLTLAEELACWQALQKKYIEGCEERKQADKEVYRVEKELNRAGFDASVKWINDRKYYNELGLEAELAAWKRVQARYLEGTAEREEADKELYRVQKEINSANEDYTTKSTQIYEDANEKRKDLLDDYYEKEKEINDKLKDDIAAVKQEYEDALKARTESLYSSYGLFDRVDVKSVSGNQLLNNLKSQVTAFEGWQQNLASLAQKGLDEDLLQELSDMGPQSAAQIAALNKLSSEKLDEYVALWKQKHADAKSQATGELVDLRIETKEEIKQLRKDAAKELEACKLDWFNQMIAINTEATKQLSTLQTEWATKMGALTANAETEVATMGADISTSVQTLRTNTEAEFTTLATNIQTIMKSPDWVAVGANIVNGMIQGIKSRSTELAYEAARTAISAYTAAKRALDENSPSKKFMELGAYASEGLAVGLSNVSGVVSSAKNVGNAAINSLRMALSNMADIVNGDLDLAPTIRPVLDLTDVKATASGLSGILSAGGNVNGRIASIITEFKANNSTSSMDDIKAMLADLFKNKDDQNQNGGDTSLDGMFKGAIFNVRNDNDIRKIAKELYNLERSASRGRGLATR